MKAKGDLAYVSARNQHNAHSVLLHAVKDSGKTIKELSAITGIDEAEVSRILGRPSNFNINSYGKLLYAASGSFLSIVPVAAPKPRAKEAK